MKNLIYLPFVALAGALRSRRAIVLMLVFLAAALMMMHFNIKTFEMFEEIMVEGLHLEKSGEVGAFADTLWRVWVQSLPWLGFALCISQMMRSSGKATVLAILAYPVLLKGGCSRTIEAFNIFFPCGLAGMFWRHTPSAVCYGVFHQVTLAFVYLSLGLLVFRRRDV